VPLVDEELLAASTLAVEMSIALIGPRAAFTEMCLDKYLLMQSLAAQGLPVPPTRLLRAGIQDMDFPLILKPRVGRGSRGVKIISSRSDWDAYIVLDLVRHVETFVRRYQPTTVLTHHSGDVNIDHRLVHDAVVTATRPQPGHSVRELLFFEVPSSTEWRPVSSAEPFNPNWFVDISSVLPKKLKALQAYQSEMREVPHPRSVKAIEALARWRGATVGVEAAETFILGRKTIK
jgi:hypothetical protein